MSRPNRAYKKEGAHKDARLFIIVAEGEREDKYFWFFNAKNRRISVFTVKREGSSAPKHFIDRLIKAQDQGDVSVKDNDQVWFVCDVDKWREQIEELRLKCEQEVNWHLAVSNPCFEVWLHFHSGSVKEDVSTCHDLKRELPSTTLGGFNAELYGYRIDEAVNNARIADTSPGHIFPDRMQTKIYKLAEEMLQLLGSNWK